MFVVQYFMCLFFFVGWALSIAMSRAFGFKRLGGWALVPLVDMANHSLISNAEIRCDESGTVKMIANKPVGLVVGVFSLSMVWLLSTQIARKLKPIHF